MPPREEIIRQIRETQTALEDLGASRENIVLSQFKDAELLDILESLKNQLSRRKEFIEENKGYKKL